jgi:hypothetical protein
VGSAAAVTGACLAMMAAMTCPGVESGDELGGSTLSEATPMLHVEQGRACSVIGRALQRGSQ